MAHTQLSLLNPFRLVPVESPLPERYHTRTFDAALQPRTLKEWEDNGRESIYLQPVERADPFRFQVSTTAAASATTLYVIDCKGNTKYSFPQPGGGAAVPGHTAADGTPFNIFQWALAGWPPELLDGQYYLVLKVDYSFENTQYFIGNAFVLAARHYGTVMIDYRHRTNHLNTFFEQIPALFSLRVGGTVGDYAPAMVSKSFDDQNKKTVLLRATAFRRWIFRVGGNGQGVSDSMLDQLNNVFTCSGLYIDGVQYTNEDGAAFEKEGEVNVPLSGASIALRDPNGDRVGDFPDPRVKITKLPVTYPYAVGGIYLIAGPDLDIARLFLDMRVINSAGELAALITELNTAITLQGANGTVTVTSDVLYYTNSFGIQYASGGAKVLPFYFQTTIEVPPPTSIHFYASADVLIRGLNFVIDWGQGETVFVTSGVPGPALAVEQYYYKPYLYGGTYNLRFFHSGTEIEAFTQQQRLVKNISGRLPVTLKVLDLAYSGLTTFDYNLLLPAQAKLETLYIYGVPTLTGGNFVLNDGSVNLAFFSLKNIRFDGCGLSAGQVSQIINGAYSTATAFNITGGYLNAATQNPAIGTLPFSTQFKIFGLTGQGWQVLY